MTQLRARDDVPKLYIYMGITIYFWSNEHKPTHIHGGCDNRVCKAEIFTGNGKVSSVKFKNRAGNNGLSPDELAKFKDFVNAKAIDIVDKWADVFVWHKTLKCRVITKKVK